MKITIEIPDILPADFERPSLELLRFVADMVKLCMSLAQRFVRADGRNIFSAYIRNGQASVFCTSDQRTAPIAGSDMDKSEADEESTEFVEKVVHPVAMDPDEPGSWVVARLCLTSEDSLPSFITLRSTDFFADQGKRTNFQKMLPKILRRLEKAAHTVPELSL